jgi:hypothetical protein
VNLPSSNFTMEVAKIGERLIVKWHYSPTIGGSGSDSGEIIMKREELHNWLSMMSDKFISYR